MDGSKESGKDMESGRDNQATNETRIWARRTDSDDGDDFDGEAIFVAEVAKVVDEPGNFLGGEWRPDHPLQGIVGSGWSGEVVGVGLLTGGVGVRGNGGKNHGTGVLGKGSGDNGVGGIGVHGIGGSGHVDDLDTPRHGCSWARRQANHRRKTATTWSTWSWRRWACWRERSTHPSLRRYRQRRRLRAESERGSQPEKD